MTEFSVRSMKPPQLKVGVMTETRGIGESPTADAAEAGKRTAPACALTAREWDEVCQHGPGFATCPIAFWVCRLSTVTP
jgi:hypothetical protein